VIVASVVRGPVRAARAGVFALITVLLACAAHVVGGETPPSVQLVVALAVPVTVFSYVLGRRQRGLVPLAAAMGATQWLLHAAFMGVATMTPVSGTTAHVGGAMPGMPGMMATDMGSASPVHAAVLHGSSTGGLVMTAAHVIAALLLSLALAHGEQLLTIVVALIGHLLRVVRELDLTLPAPLPAVAIAAPQRRHPAGLTPLPVGRRGPPASR
jgi:hypothetical protein